MRALAAAIAAAALAGLPSLANAEDKIHVLSGLDFFGVNNPGSAAPANAELGAALRADARDLGGRFDLRVDLRERLVFAGAGIDGFDAAMRASRNELHDLSLVARHLGGRFDLTVGRFAVPGGFWLINDGAALALHLGRYFAVQAYGGLRAFTSGRKNADLSGDVLPLVGGAVTVDHPMVHGALAYTYTRDLLDFHRGLSPAPFPDFATDGTTPGFEKLDRLTEPEMFLDGQLLLLPHPDVFLAGGLTFGTRYQVTFSSEKWTAAPAVDATPLASFMAYAVAEWRPVKRLRLSYAFDFDRISILVPRQPLANDLGAAGGSFEDHALKASVQIWRALRAQGKYRLRFRENTDVIHRFEGGVTGDDLSHGFGVFATVGGDVYQISRDVPDKLRHRDGVVYTGGVSFLNRLFDARAGLLYTDAIGSGVAFSSHARQAMGAGPTSELFPLVLEAQRIAFFRIFGTLRGFFAGIDAELNLDANQVRVLVQFGRAYAR